MDKLLDDNKYTWEKYSSSDGVQEDEEGNIVALASDRDRSRRAKARRITKSIRRGLIRYLVIALDYSSAALEKDFRPNRLEVIKGAVKKFILEYFDQNPISQMCLAVTRDKVAEKLTELSGNPKYHQNRINSESSAAGEASLQNILYVSMNILKNIPNYGTREVIVVYNSLKTRDPGNILETIAAARKMKLRVNIICTGAELYICKKIAEDTGGTFAVSTSPAHLYELLSFHVTPPPDLKNRETLTTDHLYMGFPKKYTSTHQVIAMDGVTPKLVTASYICPRCYTRCTELPTQCTTCRLQLTSSTHIARSHHHLFPVPLFTERQIMMSDNKLCYLLSDAAGGDGAGIAVGTVTTESVYKYLDRTLCDGCLEDFNEASLVFVCPTCGHVFCVDCDLFIHDSLHNCPRCNN